MSQLGSLGNPAATNSQISPYQLGGQLNFGNVPGLMDYSGAYANALNLNQQNYGNILAGYQGTMANQQAAQQGIQAGYGNLYNTVMGGIQGIGASQSQAIQDVYAQQAGASSQDMINRGLGNTTVQQSVQRGNVYDEQKAQIALSNQLAQLQAGYQSNLGQAGLNYANQANMQNTGLASQQLGFMNSVQAPYPNAAAYGQLALQAGYANMAKQLYGQLPRGFGGGGAYPTVAPGGGGSRNLLGNGTYDRSNPQLTFGSGAGGGGNYTPGSPSLGPVQTQPSSVYGPTYDEMGANQYGQTPGMSFGPGNVNDLSYTDNVLGDTGGDF